VPIVTAATAAGPAAPARQVAGDPILLSKIVVPGMPGWLILRPRLDKLIARGAAGPLTTVTGPPGAGKTMALAQWAATRPPGTPLAWVTVDDHDRKPRVFWSYLLAALRQAGVTVPRALSATVRRNAIDHEFLLRFASAMAAQDPPVTLVVDDVHLLTGSTVPDGLAYVLWHARPGLRLVVSSRMDPLLPLHRYRLTGDLTEIRASDLAFSAGESRLLLAEHGIALSAESLEALTRRAEGWAAILRMAAISMDGHPDPEQFAKELIAEDGAVTGYLVEEVLNAQPAKVRDFLLRTSILDRMSEELAGELAGDGREAACLADLARVSSLVQPDGSGWYRYHSLFGAVLRLKLRRDHPARVPDLHLRAARWYRRNGALAEAVRHAAEAGDWQFAARTVCDELAVTRLLEPRDDEPLAARFQGMPAELGWAEPQPPIIVAAMEFARGRNGLSGTFLGVAESALSRLPAAEEIPSRLAAALVRLALSRRTGEFGAARDADIQARTLIEAIPGDQVAGHAGIRVPVLSGHGAVTLWSGRLDEAAAIFGEAAAAAGPLRSEHERADCLGYLALIETLRGRLNRAAELVAEAEPGSGQDPGRPASPMSPAAQVALASVHLERNELARARLLLKQAHEDLQAMPDKVIGALACLVAARYTLAEGRGKAASAMIARARQGWSPPAWIEHRLMLLESWAHASLADFPPAIDIAMRAGPGSSPDAAAALARALLAAGDPHAARQALDSAAAGEPGRSQLAVCLAAAQLSYASDDRARGRRSLERALRLGEADQVRLPFVLERSWIRPVLRRDPELAHRYRRLLEPEMITPGWAGDQPGDPGQADALIVEPLSQREREVLGHLSAMKSTVEIAADMHISVNTVKTHLKSIYRKLAAARRGEAVRRARKAGLLLTDHSARRPAV